MRSDWSHTDRWQTAGSHTRSRLLAATAAATTVAALSILAVGVGSGAQASTKGSAASQLLGTALRNAASRHSVHEVVTEKAAKASGLVVSDVGTNQGRQDITRSGGVKAHVVVVGGTAYFSGNQAALVHYFGLPAAVAHKVGTRWVSVLSSSSGYSFVAGGTSLSSVLGGFAVPGQLKETAPTQVDGQPAVGITSTGPATGSTTAPASAIVYVTRSSTPLPLRAVYTYSSGASVTLQLSGWGEHLALKAPTNVIPAAQLQK